jgi:hypothetical protein
MKYTSKPEKIYKHSTDCYVSLPANREKIRRRWNRPARGLPDSSPTGTFLCLQQLSTSLSLAEHGPPQGKWHLGGN